MTLLTELDAFFTEHMRCRDLDAAVGGPVVWITCYCGASMARRVDETDDHAGAFELDPRSPPLSRVRPPYWSRTPARSCG